jgi:hypothetical protein
VNVGGHSRNVLLETEVITTLLIVIATNTITINPRKIPILASSAVHTENINPCLRVNSEYIGAKSRAFEFCWFNLSLEFTSINMRMGLFIKAQFDEYSIY